MDRRWQKGGKGRYETLESIGSLTARVPILSNSLKLCDTADFYATYSNLHSKGRRVEVATNVELGFSYFLAEPEVEPDKNSNKDSGRGTAAGQAQAEVTWHDSTHMNAYGITDPLISLESLDACLDRTGIAMRD